MWRTKVSVADAGRKAGGMHERRLRQVHCVGIARLFAAHYAYSGTVQHALLRLADASVLQFHVLQHGVLDVDVGIMSAATQRSGDNLLEIHWCDASYSASIASASVCSVATSASFMRLRSVTTGSTTVMSFICSSMARIVLPAEGAHEPFSTMPTRRRW